MKFDKLVTGVLIVAVVILGIRGECKNNKIEGLENQVMSMALQSPETLPEDVVTTAILNKHILTAMSRVDGDSVIVETHYVPVESEIRYITQVDSTAMEEWAEIQNTLIHLRENMYTEEDSAAVRELEIALENLERRLYITSYEFDETGGCFEPTIGAQVDTDIDMGVSLGVRLGYHQRWGIGAQVAANFPTDSLYAEEYPVTISAGGFVDYRIKNFENVGIKLFGDYDFTRRHWQGGFGVNFYLR